MRVSLLVQTGRMLRVPLYTEGACRLGDRLQASEIGAAWSSRVAKQPPLATPPREFAASAAGL